MQSCGKVLSIGSLVAALAAGWAEGAFAVPAGDAAAASGATSNVVLAGSFLWTGRANQKNDLRATFVPGASNTWSVTYTFQWDGKAQTFTGTAAGNLANGKVTGTAVSGGRTWRIEAHATAGHLHGRHFETTDRKKEQPTGDFDLRPDKPRAGRGGH